MGKKAIAIKKADPTDQELLIWYMWKSGIRLPDIARDRNLSVGEVGKTLRKIMDYALDWVG